MMQPQGMMAPQQGPQMETAPQQSAPQQEGENPIAKIVAQSFTVLSDDERAILKQRVDPQLAQILTKVMSTAVAMAANMSDRQDGSYMVPTDAVRNIGTSKLDSMVQKAKEQMAGLGAKPAATQPKATQQ